MIDPRIKKLAEVLVNYSVAIEKNDLVVIQGPPVAEPLVVALYEAVIHAGGHPQVRMSPDVLAELLLKHGSEEQLRYVSPLALHEVETINARIGIWAEVNTRSLTNTEPGRQAINSAARKPIFTRFLARSAAKDLRWTGTLFPTQASAQDAGMSLLEYEDFVFNAGHLEHDDPASVWRDIARKQQHLIDRLNGRNKLHLEASNGTDLTMSLQDRRWINCCGDCNFPDGEVFTSPVEDSVEGVIAFSFPALHMGHECDGVKLRFEKGKVVQATAEKGEAFLNEMLDQDEGARRVGEFALGTNYNITRFSRNTLFDEKIGGTVHLAVGASLLESGGQNESGLHWDMVCDLREGGRVRVDNELICENGKFRVIDL